MYVWIGLGVLTKGPIAALIPVAVTLLYALLSGRLREWRKAAFDPVSWLLLAAIVAPWYGYALHVHGRAFVEGFFVKHNLQRFGGTLEGHSGSIVYYVVVVPLLLLPWTGLLVPALRAARDEWRIGLTRYLWLWFAFVLVFFSVSGTKLPHYALYGLTPLFVLAAMHRADLGAGRLARVTAALLLALMPALPWIAQRWALGATGPRTAYYAALAQHALQAAPWSFYAISGCACAIGIAALCAPRWPTWYRLAMVSGNVRRLRRARYCSSAWFFFRTLSRCSSASVSASVRTAGLPDAIAFTSAYESSWPPMSAARRSAFSPEITCEIKRALVSRACHKKASNDPSVT